MSIFRTRRVNGDQASFAERAPAVTDAHEGDPDFASIEGVTLDHFVVFMAKIGAPNTTALQHESIARGLGFPLGRYDLIRNAWMVRVYSSPALAREFGVRLDDARRNLRLLA